jgi:hypothetical protein
VYYSQYYVLVPVDLSFCLFVSTVYLVCVCVLCFVHAKAMCAKAFIHSAIELVLFSPPTLLCFPHLWHFWRAGHPCPFDHPLRRTILVHLWHAMCDSFSPPPPHGCLEGDSPWGVCESNRGDATRSRWVLTPPKMSFPSFLLLLILCVLSTAMALGKTQRWRYFDVIVTQ